MRTSIYLDRDENGDWDTRAEARHIDISHESPLTEDEVDLFRTLGKAAADVIPGAHIERPDWWGTKAQPASEQPRGSAWGQSLGILPNEKPA